MSTGDMVGMTENERREFPEAFERAHDAGEVSDKDFARARIGAAIARWHLAAWEAAGKPEKVPDAIYDDRPVIKGVGIPAIDDALPYLQAPSFWPEGMPLMRDNPDRWQIAARLSFLSGMEYLLQEKSDALECSERRKEPVQKAVHLIREAAALLDAADNPLLATLLYSIGEHAKKARYGKIYHLETYAGYIIPDWTPGMINNQKLADEHTRRGVLLNASYTPDALTGALVGKQGGKSRDANIVKAIAQFFPDSQEFRSASSGYAIIANLAALCELTGKTAQANPNEYVRALLKKGRT
ncbi:hypothetical protein HF563_05120 [Acidithiobacillus ferridurans]|nr:hypothetical protein [Acidithiobacillus ferridurans]